MDRDATRPEANSDKAGDRAGAAAEAYIRLRNVSKSFNSSATPIEILKGIDFDIHQGETLAVVGASGIGKSTLLHILGTLDRPDSGTVLYAGQDVFAFSRADLAGFRNRRIGFMFQFHHLLPEFSALENAMMPALISGYKKKAAGAAAESVLVRVGLQDRLSHRVGKLSGGEQQRVALARALVLKPSVLLADEPTGNLDQSNSEQVHDLLFQLNQELAMTMVVVTHNMQLASYMTRCVTIIDGQLIENG